MPDLTAYQDAARRILAEWRHIEGTTLMDRWNQLDPEMVEAVAELVAMTDMDFPLQPLPPMDQLPFPTVDDVTKFTEVV